MIGNRLDRYFVRRACVALVGIVALVCALVIGLDIIFNLKNLLKGALPEDASRPWMIVRLYLFRLPSLMSPLVPLAMMAAVILTTAPSLKKGEFTALAAAGISLRKSTRSLLLVAAIAGALDVYLSDRLAPRLEGRVQAMTDALSGEARSGRIWVVEETGTPWYANRVILVPGEIPRVEDILVAPAAYPGLIHAEKLGRDDDGNWFLDGPVRRIDFDDEGRRRFTELDALPCEGSIALPYDSDKLGQILVSRYAMTGDELWRRGLDEEQGHLYHALLYRRYSRALLPLFAVLLVLPMFVRFQNRDEMLVAGIRSLVFGLVPIGILSIGGMEADRRAGDPLLTLGGAAGLALLPGLVAYVRWKM